MGWGWGGGDLLEKQKVGTTGEYSVCVLNPLNQEILLPPLFMRADYCPPATGEFDVLSPAALRPQTFTRQTPHGPPIYLTPGVTWDMDPPKEKGLLPYMRKRAKEEMN